MLKIKTQIPTSKFEKILTFILKTPECIYWVEGMKIDSKPIDLKRDEFTIDLSLDTRLKVDGRWRVLSPKKLEKALELLSDLAPKLWEELWGETISILTGYIFFQYCVLGEHRFE